MFRDIVDKPLVGQLDSIILQKLIETQEFGTELVATDHRILWKPTLPRKWKK